MTTSKIEAPVLRPVLGRRYSDRVTGFSGTCTTIARYIDGATRVGLDEDGTARNEWFDVRRLVEVPRAPRKGKADTATAVTE